MTDRDSWAEYARLQQYADFTTLNDKYWAVDEALDAILDKIEAGETVSAQQTENLIINRAAKHRRRRADLTNHSAVLFSFSAIHDEHRLHARARLLECHAQCSPREWSALVSIGLGHTYRAVAYRHSVPEPTAKPNFSFVG